MSLIWPNRKVWTAADIPDRPHFEAEGFELLQRRVRDARVYLEYGAGGSTILAAQLGAKEIHTVESDKSFLEAVRQRVTESRPDARIFPYYVDIGPTKRWGMPTDPTCATRWPQYCLAPWQGLLAAGSQPDLVLVDGRFRVACFLASMMFAGPGAVVLFDDYFNRENYHLVEKHFAPTSRAGRMAEFIVPADLDHRSVMLSLLPSLTDPA